MIGSLGLLLCCWGTVWGVSDVSGDRFGGLTRSIRRRAVRVDLCRLALQPQWLVSVTLSLVASDARVALNVGPV